MGKALFSEISFPWDAILFKRKWQVNRLLGW